MNLSHNTSSFANFFRQLGKHRAMVLAMAGRDLQSRYAGTLGGTLWAFAHPIAIVGVFYFVFAVGFKAQGPADTPFILWFIGGLVPWFFFNDTLLAITHSVTSNAHLVKKTVFPTEVLPFVHILSGLFPHAIFLAVLGILMVAMNVPFMPERLMVAYYLICTITLLLGLGWLLSALQVFYRDIAQAIAILLNIVFWATPIVWSAQILPASYQSLLVYNPVFYLAEGYRTSLVSPQPTLPNMVQTLYFWGMAMGMLLTGMHVFRRLKPEFADVM